MIFLTLLKPFGCTIRFALYVGDDAIASTAPVFASSTTTAPQRPASWSSASLWMSGRSVRITSSPWTVLPPSLSSVCLSVLLRFVFAPVR